MTDKEKAIVMAYTGVCMLSGDKFKIFHSYIEDIMGRPVYTHELGIKAVKKKIKKKAKADFMELCADESSSENPNKWIPITKRPMTGRWITWKEAGNLIPSETRFECSVCHDAAQTLCNGLDLLSPYCPNCGAKMAESEE